MCGIVDATSEWVANMRQASRCARAPVVLFHRSEKLHWPEAMQLIYIYINIRMASVLVRICTLWLTGATGRPGAALQPSTQLPPS